MNGQELSGEALLKALEEQTLAPRAPAGITLVGMVKQSKEPGCIGFAATCDAWIDIPTHMIDKAVQLGDRRCRDHVHLLFRITLKEPPDEEGKLLGKLLMASQGGGGGGGFDCDIFCQALLKACLERTPFSIACVIFYQICYGVCRIPGDIFGVAARQPR
jgi:hypothetical protein